MSKYQIRFEWENAGECEDDACQDLIAQTYDAARMEAALRYAVVGELDDETVASIETAEYGDDGQPLPGGGLKQMLIDMATSGVWDVESDDVIAEPRLIP